MNVENLLNNSVGVAEHPDVMDSIEKELAVIQSMMINYQFWISTLVEISVMGKIY